MTIEDKGAKTMQGSRVIAGAAKGAGHILSGEARERLDPIKRQLLDGSAGIQSKAGRRIIELADKIREIGGRLERGREAQAVARKLEETADYLRFRPASDIAEDAARAFRRSRLAPIAVGLAGAWLAYKVVSWRVKR